MKEKLLFNIDWHNHLPYVATIITFMGLAYIC